MLSPYERKIRARLKRLKKQARRKSLSARERGKLGGRPRLPAALKQLRGTFVPGREEPVAVPPDAPLLPARDFMAIAEDYATLVRSGAQVCCELIRLAIDRQDRDLASSPYVFSPTHAMIPSPASSNA